MSLPETEHRPNRPTFLWRGGPPKRHRRYWIAAISVVVIGLGFVGCLSLRESTYWKTPKQEDVAPRIEVDRLVRVRLGGREASGVRSLAVESTYNLADAKTGHLLAEHAPRLPKGKIGITADGKIRLGNHILSSNDILITPKRDASLIVDDKTYRGVLQIRVVKDGITLTNHVDIESYLRGVLRGELPRRFHEESFKAQCVAARTYVLYQKRTHGGDRSFDVYDNEGSQMYIGVAGEDRKVIDAVEATRGEVCMCTYKGKEDIFCTYYCSTCGGRTQAVRNFKPNDPDVPPLCGGVICRDCYLAKFYRWDPVTLSKEEVTNRVVARYPSVRKIGTIKRLRPKDRTVDGRIIRMQLIGSTGENETLVGEDFRLVIGGRVLKSANFEINDTGDAFVFTDGKGYGHGVGLCQHGMETKARRGWDYRKILTTYYPGATIKRLY